MDTYLVINRRSDFAGGLLVNLRSEGEGLTLSDARGAAPTFPGWIPAGGTSPGRA